MQPNENPSLDSGGDVHRHRFAVWPRGANETFRVTVCMDSGVFETVPQDDITDLRSGDRVRVEGRRACLR